MIIVPDSAELADFNLADYAVPPLDKNSDNRGFMYILYDSMYPNYIKVGRTCNCRKRLVQYNADKPFPTAKMQYVSNMFTDVNDVERKILQYMYDNTAPTTLTKEWFEIEHKQRILCIIEKAELSQLQEN